MSNKPLDHELHEPDPKLRKLSAEEFRSVLDDHKIWLESEGSKGKRADLSDVNLAGRMHHRTYLEEAKLARATLVRVNLYRGRLICADLTSANLEGAYLKGIDLQGAYLKDAILDNADLTGAKLHGANCEGTSFKSTILEHAHFEKTIDCNGAYLAGADFSEAKLANACFHGAILKRACLKQAELIYTDGLEEAELQDANFEGVIGLKGNEFARNDITGTTLPKEIHEFKTLHVIEETSKNARSIFISMLLGCVYTLLTVATTTDAHLLTNTASSPLPIIGSAIPIVYFYWFAPIFLMMIYLYFHFYLQRLWEGMSGLPAKFPDSKRLDEHAYPWLLNGLVRRYFSILKDDRPPVAKVEEMIVILLGWWVVPATLVVLWLRYLPRHDWTGTSLHILLLMISCIVAVWFLSLAKSTLRGEKSHPEQRTRRFPIIKPIGYFIAFGISSVVIIYISWFGMNIGPTYSQGVFNLISFTGYTPYAKLVETDLSTKPPNWTGKNEQVELVKGVHLLGANLQYAYAYKVFLVKADLRGANLSNGSFGWADLRKAKLNNANLFWTELTGANLEEANFEQANLQSADLTLTVGLTPEMVKKADNWMLAVYDREFAIKLGLLVSHGDRFWDKRWGNTFRGSDFSNTSMRGARLIGADLSEVNLQKAYLNDAILENATLVKANLREAFLQRTNLKGADLQGSSLVNASLAKANLQGAILRGADFSGAFLGNCKGLTQKQLDDACGNEKTNLPTGLLIKYCKKEDNSSPPTNNNN